MFTGCPGSGALSRTVAGGRAFAYPGRVTGADAKRYRVLM